jgi:hypothetical protein
VDCVVSIEFGETVQVNIYGLNNASEISLYSIILGFIFLCNQQDYTYIAFRYIQHLKTNLNSSSVILNILRFYVQ